MFIMFFLQLTFTEHLHLQNKLPVIKIWTQENLDKEVRPKYIIY